MSHNRISENSEQIVPPADLKYGENISHRSADLANVLEQVISASRGNAAVSVHDMALRQQLDAVAPRFSGCDLALDPILVSLVDAVTSRLRHLTAQQRSAMCQAVARTLYDDSESRSRLERLWHSLKGSTERGSTERGSTE